MFKNKLIQISKSNIFKGTIILTVSVFITRIIGFFFRIFLTKHIGAEGLGIFQLIFPVQIICYALCGAGFEMAISKYVSSCQRKHPEKCGEYLKNGLFMSLICSLITGFLVFINSEFISERLILEPRCLLLVKVLSFSVPFASIHACFCGYFLGLKNTRVSAVSGIIEQLVRVVSTTLIIMVLVSNGFKASPLMAVIGTVAGEVASSSYCLYYYKKRVKRRYNSHLSGKYIGEIIKMGFPISLNKLMLSILQSIQSVLIPAMLIRYGCSIKEALSIYGILLGLIIPLISFPGAFINSLSLLLLPTVSEAESNGSLVNITSSIKKITKICFIFGLICSLMFINFSKLISIILFKTDYSYYIKTIGIVCPFMFTNTVLTSVINGLGKTHVTFIHNLAISLLQIISIVILVPEIGIAGYITGVIISSVMMAFSLCRYIKSVLKN